MVQPFHAKMCFDKRDEVQKRKQYEALSRLVMTCMISVMCWYVLYVEEGVSSVHLYNHPCPGMYGRITSVAGERLLDLCVSVGRMYACMSAVVKSQE